MNQNKYGVRFEYFLSNSGLSFVVFVLNFGNKLRNANLKPY